MVLVLCGIGSLGSWVHASVGRLAVWLWRSVNGVVHVFSVSVVCALLLHSVVYLVPIPV